MKTNFLILVFLILSACQNLENGKKNKGISLKVKTPGVEIKN